MFLIWTILKSSLYANQNIYIITKRPYLNFRNTLVTFPNVHLYERIRKVGTLRIFSFCKTKYHFSLFDKFQFRSLKGDINLRSNNVLSNVDFICRITRQTFEKKFQLCDAIQLAISKLEFFSFKTDFSLLLIPKTYLRTETRFTLHFFTVEKYSCSETAANKYKWS